MHFCLMLDAQIAFGLVGNYAYIWGKDIPSTFVIKHCIVVVQKNFWEEMNSILCDLFQTHLHRCIYGLMVKLQHGSIWSLNALQCGNANFLYLAWYVYGCIAHLFQLNWIELGSIAFAIKCTWNNNVAGAQRSETKPSNCVFISILSFKSHNFLCLKIIWGRNSHFSLTDLMIPLGIMHASVILSG